MASKVAIVDPLIGALTDDLLTPEVRLWQRHKGHRFSSDDVATAYVAFHAQLDAKRVLDLGTGIGSVLFLLAYRMPEAQFTGVEAQDESFELLSRNVARNACGSRVTIHHGDLRSDEVMGQVGTFQLITGTPPYFPFDAALAAEDTQREFARLEHRGGVEAYVERGAKHLEPHGAMVLCGDAHADRRVIEAAGRVGLGVSARTQIVPRAGRPPLFSVWTLRKATGAHAVCEQGELMLRDEAGAPAEGANLLRAFSGFPPRT